MARYTPKNNKVYFGWEGDFKKIDGATVDEAEFADVDFMVNLESIDIDTIKPKTERTQKWFLGNTTRVNSYTYDTQYTPGSGSFGGELKHGHLIDAVCGGAVATQTNSGYQECGLEHKTLLDLTGLAITTLYDFGVNVDGAGSVNYTIDTTGETVEFENIIDLMNESIDTNSAEDDAYFSLVDGDLRCTSYLTGGSSTIALAAGSGNTDLFATLTGFTAFKTAIIGGSYDTITLSGGGVRSSFFMRFEHGTSHMKDLLGCIGTEITLNGSENSFTTYTANLLSARMYPDVNATVLSGDASNMEDVDRPPYHWKHASISLSLDNGMSVYTANSRNQVESVETIIRNLTEYKFGAPSTGGTKWANWFKEMKFESEANITVFPEDEVLWLICPSENEYVNYSTMATVRYDGMTVAFTKKLLVTGGTSGANGYIVYDYNTGTNGFLFLKTVSGSFLSGESITDSGSGTADVYNANKDIQVSNTYDETSGPTDYALHGLSTQSYYIIINGDEQAISCTSGERMDDLVGDLNTAYSGTCTWSADLGGNLRCTMDNDESGTILIETGSSGDDLISAIAGYLALGESREGFHGCDPKLTVQYKRDSNDFVRITLDHLVGMTISERMENIDAGVDPVTVSFNLAKSTAGTNVLINDPLNDNSYSDTY